MKGRILATKDGHFKEFSATAWRIMPPGRYGWMEVDEAALGMTKPTMPEELVVKSFEARPEFNVPPLTEVDPMTGAPEIPAPPRPAGRVKKNPVTAENADRPKKRRARK